MKASAASEPAEADAPEGDEAAGDTRARPGTRGVDAPARKGRQDAVDLSDMPAGLAEHVQTLLSSADRKARKAASDALLEHAPQDAVPVYARNIAWLERAAGCDAKKAVIKKIGDEGDKRPLGALRMLARTPKKGCGALDLRDCYECLRETLARTIGQLEAP